MPLLLLRFLFIAVILNVMTSCSPKISIEHIDLLPDSLIGYTVIAGQTAAKAYMLLFPGFGEGPDDVIAQSDLPSALARNDINVFIPVLQNGKESYGFSDESQNCLKGIVEEIRVRHNLTGKPYFIGGFSMGGATAVKFAENTESKPAALFAIDSPLDYKRFLYATQRDIEVYGKDRQDRIYSRLYEAIDKIKDESPYEIADYSHSAIKPLRDIPTRVYIEPAEDWWLNNRQRDALGLNIIDATCFVNDLRLLGNNKAEIIVTTDKGFRNGGKQRHPHSWSIVNTEDLIKWLDSTIHLLKK